MGFILNCMNVFTKLFHLFVLYDYIVIYVFIIVMIFFYYKYMYYIYIDLLFEYSFLYFSSILDYFTVIHITVTVLMLNLFIDLFYFYYFMTRLYFIYLIVFNLHLSGLILIHVWDCLYIYLIRFFLFMNVWGVYLLAFSYWFMILFMN